MNKISGVFATYDRVAENWGNPFVAPHAGIAVRGFTDAIIHPAGPSDISNHPEDFDLYQIGEYDAERGTLIPDPDPLGRKPLVQGAQVRRTAT